MAQEKKTRTIIIDPRKLKGFTRGQELLSKGHFLSAAETWLKSMKRLLKEKEYKKAGFVALQAQELLNGYNNPKIPSNEKNMILAYYLDTATSKLRKLTGKDETLPAAQKQLLGHYSQIHNHLALGHYSDGDFSNACKNFLLANNGYNETLIITGDAHASFIYEVQRTIMIYKATIAQLCLKDHTEAENIFKIAECNVNNFLKKNPHDLSDQNHSLTLECELVFNILLTAVNVAVDKTPSKEELSNCLSSAEALTKHLHLSYKLRYITVAEIINMLELIRTKLKTPTKTVLRITEVCYELTLLSVDYASSVDHKKSLNEIAQENSLEIRPYIKGLHIMEIAIAQMNNDQHEKARENFIKTIGLLGDQTHLALDTNYAFVHSAIFNRHFSDIHTCTKNLFSLFLKVFSQELLPNQYQDELKKFQDYYFDIMTSCRLESKFSEDETIKSMWNNLAETAKKNLNYIAEFIDQKIKGKTPALPEQERTLDISEKHPLLESKKSPLQYCTDALEAIDQCTAENINELETIAKRINMQHVICQRLLQTIKDKDRQSLLERQSLAFGNLLYTAGALVKNLEHTLNDKPDLLFTLSWLHFSHQEFSSAAKYWIQMVSNHPNKHTIDLVWLMINKKGYSDIALPHATLNYLNSVAPILKQLPEFHHKHVELQAHNYFLIAADYLHHKNHKDAVPALLESRKHIEVIEMDSGHSVSICINSALLASCFTRIMDFKKASTYLKNARDILTKTKVDGKGLQTLALGCEIHLELRSGDPNFKALSIIPLLQQYKQICDHLIPIEDYLMEILFHDLESIASLLIKKLGVNHIKPQENQIISSLIGKLLQILQYAKYNQKDYKASEEYFQRLEQFYSDDLSTSLHLLCGTLIKYESGNIKGATSDLTKAKLLIPKKSDGLFVMSVLSQDTICSILDRDVARLTKAIPSVNVLLSSIISENNSARIKNAYLIFSEITSNIINYCDNELSIKNSQDKQEIAKKLLHYTLTVCLKQYSELDKMSFKSNEPFKTLASNNNIMQLVTRVTPLSNEITNPLGTTETSKQCVNVLGHTETLIRLSSKLELIKKDETQLFASKKQNNQLYRKIFFGYVQLKREINDHERSARHLLHAIDTFEHSSSAPKVMLKNALQNHIKQYCDLLNKVNVAHDEKMKPNAYPHFYRVAFYAGTQDKQLRRSHSLCDIFCEDEGEIVRLSHC